MNRAGPNFGKDIKAMLASFFVMICSNWPKEGCMQQHIRKVIFSQLPLAQQFRPSLSATRCTCCEIISEKKEKAYDGYGKSSSRS